MCMTFWVFAITFLVAILVALLVASQFIFGKKSQKKSSTKNMNRKDKANILKNSNRRLAQNPKDPKALSALSDLYFSEGDYDKAMRALSILEEVAQSNRNLNQFQITKKYAISLLKTGNADDAYRAFLRADSINPSDFEVNYHIGVLEYRQQNYDVAVTRLQAAKNRNIDHTGAVRFLGLTLYKLHRHKQAMVELRKALDANPEDKEVMFAISQCYSSFGNKEKALKILTNLRTDPKFGSLACLYAGEICYQSEMVSEAIGHFEMGLKQKEVKPEISIELKYRMAMAYIQEQNLIAATELFKEIKAISPNYKDVQQQIRKYAELITNKNLSTYLLSGNSEFANLCRKISTTFFPHAHVKVLDITITQNQYLDIVAEISTRRWEDLVIFRFIRNTGQVSDLIVRELYSKIKEEKAGRGLCLTAGSFSDDAKAFVEARLIDLIEREELEKRLKKIDPTTY